jgi:hypothetical protein
MRGILSAHAPNWKKALLLPACACATSRASADVTFQLIADQNTLSPTGFATGQPFASFGIADIDHGNIAFVAGVGKGQGVYTSNDGQLQTLADQSTVFPGPSQNLNGIFGLNISGTNYAFFDGNNGSPGGSYFSIINGAFTQVTGPVIDIDRPVVDEDRVWFTVVSGPQGDNGLYYEISGSTATHVFQASASTIPERVLYDGSPLAIKNGNVVIATLGPLYEYCRSTGQVTDLADTSTPVPGGTGNFSKITLGGQYNLSFDGSEIGFLAEDSQSNPGYYLHRNGTLCAIAINGAPAPGGGILDVPASGFLAAISVDSGHVAFESSDADFDDSAIYTDATGDGLERLIGTGDTLDGQQVSGVLMTNEALSGSQLVFTAQFTDGDQGIFLANLPEPACLSLLSLGGLLILSRRRKSK